jgi:hypothetical protein
VIGAHQPGSEPIDIPETIPNPVVVPKPVPVPTEPTPKEPVRTPEKVPQNVFVPAKATGASFFHQLPHQTRANVVQQAELESPTHCNDLIGHVVG